MKRTFVIGDIQGCLGCLEKLLKQVEFNASGDKLLAVGDLVNRGPHSLETLRFCRSLGKSFRTVLGNHDLHLLAVARSNRKPSRKDTFKEILAAKDREELLGWLQSQPLVMREGKYTLAHAGIPPLWTIKEAEERAREVEKALQSDSGSLVFFEAMYGNSPHTWRDDLTGTDRLRCITNYFTRMRYCTAQGTLDLENKLSPEKGPAGFQPWFAIPRRKAGSDKILFGHWASLQGRTGKKNIIALDTGCVWGGRLRMLCLESGEFHHHDCGSGCL